MKATKTRPQAHNGWHARWFNFVLWLAIFTIFIVFLRAVEPILLPFVLGILVAYLMDPLACRLVKMGVNRSLATAIITLSLLGIITALVMWLVPIIYEQMSILLSRAPDLLHSVERNVREFASPLMEKLDNLKREGGVEDLAADSDFVQRGVARITMVIHGLFASGAELINVLALLLITPIVCFYLIRDWPSMIKSVDHMLPLAYAPTIREQLRLINRTLAAYLRGQVTVMIIMSVFYIICFAIMGLHFGLLLGLLAGCIVIIPYIGSAISISLGLIVAYGQYETSTGFWFVVAIYAAGQLLESQILTPKIIGDRVGLHPLWMLFGMLAGAVLLGFVGVLLAVPLTAVIGVLAKFAVSRYLQSGLYLDS